MKRGALALWGVMVGVCAYGAVTQPSPITYGPTDPVHCSQGQIFYNQTVHALKVCSAVDTWSTLGVASASSLTLNGLVTNPQGFANDTNVTIVSSGSTHTVTWAGTLAKGRQNAATVYKDAGNVYSGANTQDFSAISHVKLPVAAGYTPSANGHIGFDSTANAWKTFISAAVKTFAYMDSNITGTSAGITGYTIPGSGTALGTTTGARTAGKCVEFDAGGNLVVAVSNAACGQGGGGGAGSVTSVGLSSTPTWLTITGSPITTSGTMAITATGGQGANLFLATPSNTLGAVSLRAIQDVDIPASLSATTSINGTSIPAAATLMTTVTSLARSQTPLNTKGDLLSTDGANLTRVGVGTNGQVVTADNTQASGFKWATPTTGAPSIGTVNSLNIADGAGAWANSDCSWGGTGLALNCPGGFSSGGPMAVSGQTSTAPSSPSSGTVKCWADSTALTFQCKNAAGNVFTLAKTGTTCTTGQHATGLNSDGTINCTADSSTGGGAFAASEASGTTWTVGGATHGFGTCDLSINVTDASYNQIQASKIACNSSTFDVTVTFDVAQAGHILILKSGGTAAVSSAVLQRPCEIVVGDPGLASSVLADDNDTPHACTNDTGSPLTVTAVHCYAPVGTPTVQPQITGGTSTSIVTGAFQCSTGDAAGTLNGSPIQSAGQSIDINIGTAGGSAKYLVVRVSRTL